MVGIRSQLFVLISSANSKIDGRLMYTPLVKLRLTQRESCMFTT